MLAAAHAANFAGLNAQQKAIVDSVIALRNHIAHRSQRSLDATNDVLARAPLHPTGIRRLGAWLKSTPAGRNQSRFADIINILDDIGATF